MRLQAAILPRDLGPLQARSALVGPCVLKWLLTSLPTHDSPLFFPTPDRGCDIEPQLPMYALAEQFCTYDSTEGVGNV